MALFRTFILSRILTLRLYSRGPFKLSEEQKIANEWFKSFSANQIPVESFLIKHSRSGGAGGQNVNKVSTRVEMSFRLADANWIPKYVRAKLGVIEGGRVTKEGYFQINSSRYRSQFQNHKDCLEKLMDAFKNIIEEIPKETSKEKVDKVRRMIKSQNESRIKEKKQNSMRKSLRKISKEF